MAVTSLWVEDYRPKTIEDYVFGSEDQRAQVEKWVEAKSFGNLMLVGGAGTGKSSLAKLLISLCGIDEYDVLTINASKETGVDGVRDRISNFVGTMPYGDFKVVLLEEADFFSTNAMAALRALMEECHDTARFILTANYAHKLIPALHSRCQKLEFAKLDKTEYTARVATVLLTEEIDFDLETLELYVTAAYPDLRKCINAVQQYSVGGKLSAPDSSIGGSSEDDYLISAVALFKSGKHREARQVICTNMKPDDVDTVFRWMYDNLELWGSTPEQQDEAILIIRKGLVNAAVCADVEINVSAAIIELTQLT